MTGQEENVQFIGLIGDLRASSALQVLLLGVVGMGAKQTSEVEL